MGLPNMSHALNGWDQKRTVTFITKDFSYNPHLRTDVVTTGQYLCMVQPTPPENIARKPEEQRSWKFQTLWFKNAPLLRKEDKVQVKGKTYVIKSVGDWDDYGYRTYDAIEDYQ